MAKGKGKMRLYGSRELLESDNAVPDSEINGEGAPTAVLPVDPPEAVSNEPSDDAQVTDSSPRPMMPWWSWIAIFIVVFMFFVGFDMFF